MDVRLGHGYDVHAFEDGDHVILCGVKIPHTHALRGHSDADVGLHAITDAIYGALCDGDIGRHFPRLIRSGKVLLVIFSSSTLSRLPRRVGFASPMWIVR